jgi:hypothetical protein
MLRPPETAVNRCAGRQDDPGVGCQKKENVPNTMSRRVASQSLYLVVREASLDDSEQRQSNRSCMRQAPVRSA